MAMSAVAVVNLWVRAFSEILGLSRKFRLYIGLRRGGLALEEAHHERQKVLCSAREPGPAAVSPS